MVMLNPNFWRGKRVFVTGHTGFKGSWLSLWLQNLGANVTGYSLPPPTTPNLFELADVDSSMNSIEGDVRDLSGLFNAFRLAEPEIVFHLAAQPLVRQSYSDPVNTFSSNVMGTVNLLESIRQFKETKAAVIVTTDKCYENKEWIWAYREDEPMGGHDPYSSSKGCTELVVSSYRRSFFSLSNSSKIATARAGNVIGGGDFSQDRLIPDIIRAAKNSSRVEIRNPSAIRPWQHVLEPLSGYLKLAERLFLSAGSDFSDAWNFGPNESDSWSVEQVIKCFRRHLLVDLDEPIFCPPSHLHEAHFLKLDISKAKYKLGWVPRLHLEQGLKWTADWYSEYLKEKNVKMLTQGQLEAYSEKFDLKN